jgi:hypothetical protein
LGVGLGDPAGARHLLQGIERPRNRARDALERGGVVARANRRHRLRRGVLAFLEESTKRRRDAGREPADATDVGCRASKSSFVGFWRSRKSRTGSSKIVPSSADSDDSRGARGGAVGDRASQSAIGSCGISGWCSRAQR